MALVDSQRDITRVRIHKMLHICSLENVHFRKANTARRPPLLIQPFFRWWTLGDDVLVDDATGNTNIRLSKTLQPTDGTDRAIWRDLNQLYFQESLNQKWNLPCPVRHE